jgi:hypothetical protein
MAMTPEAIREAHAQYSRTRCGAWLAATGNRPIGGVVPVSLAKGPIPVAVTATPYPLAACDVHPVDA